MPRPADPRATVEIAFTLNGEPRTVTVPAEERLLDTLRYRLALPGTKEGCGEGECGACTVLMDSLPVNSCLVPAYQARGSELRTVEAVDATEVDELWASGATQCGACTPGVVMTARWLIDQPAPLEQHSVRQLMAGNLCRCTGYDGIVEGVEAALERRSSS